MIQAARAGRARRRVRARAGGRAARALARGRRTGRGGRAPTLREPRAHARAGLAQRAPFFALSRARRAARHRAQPAAKKAGALAAPEGGGGPGAAGAGGAGLELVRLRVWRVPATKLTPTAAVTKGWEASATTSGASSSRRHGFLLKEDEDVYDDNLTMKERMNISQGKFISINGAARNNLAAIDPELVYKR